MATVTIAQLRRWGELEKLIERLAHLDPALIYGQSFELWNIDEAGALTVRPIPAEEIYIMTNERNKDTPAHPDRDHSGGKQPGGQKDPRDQSGRQPAQSDPSNPENKDVHDKNDIRQ
jgi:hypothetical protein